MQATLTGLKYKLQIRETKLGPESIAIKIYEVNLKTCKFKPKPTITVYTNVSKFTQVLLDEYETLPFPPMKGEIVEQETNP